MFRTSRMSGSFQPPGPAYFARPTVSSRLTSMLGQLGAMSSVVLQELPTCTAADHKQSTDRMMVDMQQMLPRQHTLSAQSQGSPTPQSHLHAAHNVM